MLMQDCYNCKYHKMYTFQNETKMVKTTAASLKTARLVNQVKVHAHLIVHWPEHHVLNA